MASMAPPPRVPSSGASALPAFARTADVGGLCHNKGERTRNHLPCENVLPSGGKWNRMSTLPCTFRKIEFGGSPKARELQSSDGERPWKENNKRCWSGKSFWDRLWW